MHGSGVGEAARAGKREERLGFGRRAWQTRGGFNYPTMNWYYAIGQEQKGPVSDEQLHALAKDGVVTGDTLVWREGLSNWQPYRTVAPPGTVPPPPPQVEPARAPGVVATAPVSATFTPQPDLVYAGFWIRFVAKFIDGLVLGIPVGIIVLVGIMAMGGFAAVTRRGQDMAFLIPLGQLVLQLVVTGLTVIYNAVLVGMWGTTLGKKACGLAVVKADGGRISHGRAWGRAFAEIVSGLVCYIGYIIAGFDEQKRALHDHMCDTRVVRVR
jgi:uncharacterized RDD family membrane protein YckC